MHGSSAYPSLGYCYVSDETFQSSFDNHVPEGGDAWNFEHESEMSTSVRKNSTAAGASCSLVVVAANILGTQSHPPPMTDTLDF